MNEPEIIAYKSHNYHLVNPSFWPFFGSLSVCCGMFGAVFTMHKMQAGYYLLGAGFFFTLFTMFFWWKDVIKEGRVDKEHTPIVQKGLKIGMLLFIISEIMFFFAFFFSFFHATVFPIDIFVDFWPVKEGIWPPEGIKTLDAWDVPFMNTLILLLSGTSVTWAHYGLLNNDKESLVQGLGVTVLLGFIFSGFQVYEYVHALNHNFDFTSSVYGANFYMATGFHGFHVLVGTIFLAVCFFRARSDHFTEDNHLGFEFAAWYWHFVDVVWLFLFCFVYIWGA